MDKAFSSLKSKRKMKTNLRNPKENSHKFEKARVAML